MQFVSDTTDRLDKIVTGKALVSRGRVQRAVKDGLIKVNGEVIDDSNHKIQVGDKIEFPEFTEDVLQPMEYDLKIVFENDDILVIDKPANLVVHPGAGHKQDTLSNVLIGKYPGIREVGDPARPGIIHRLDEDTSGLIVTAKTTKGFDYMKNLFLTRQISKEYITLVHGIPDKLHDTINAPLEKASTHQKMRVLEAGTSSDKSKEAVTEYRILKTNEENQPSDAQNTEIDKMALLRVKLHTGRTHQIRAHMAHIGHPVVGDQLYGGTFKRPDLELINRQFLHAAQLKFKLADGTNLDLTSDLPDDLKEVLTKVHISYDALI